MDEDKKSHLENQRSTTEGRFYGPESPAGQGVGSAAPASSQLVRDVRARVSLLRRNIRDTQEKIDVLVGLLSVLED